MAKDHVYDEASEIEARNDTVVVDGPDGVAVLLTPEAAEETAERLKKAARIARIVVRAERFEDRSIISDVVRRAYADIPYSDHREHMMVERLRDTDAYVPALSLLAEIDGEVVGHVLLTKAVIQGEQSAVETLALAPLSVAPPFQRRGVGGRLIDSAHDQAAELGFGSIILVGIPSYHPRFGYKPLSRYPISLPFDAPEQNSMIRCLTPGALDGVSGKVLYPPEWLSH